MPALIAQKAFLTMNSLSSPENSLPTIIEPLSAAVIEPAIALGRSHAQRLREIYRSAGWPCQDMVEIELLAGGMLERVAGPAGHETLREHCGRCLAGHHIGGQPVGAVGA